jgi:iron complex outermembrane receptor protein
MDRHHLLLTVAAIALTAGTARAQEAPQVAQTETAAKSSGLEEITVTAEKQTENLQQTPAAVSVISGDTLVSQGIQNISAAAALVPSVRFSPEEANTQIFVRGIGASIDLGPIDPQVAYNTNSVYTPREATGQALYDIDQIEVLPGPQGTLYGRSAAGGTVNVSTKRPTDEFESDGILEVGNYALVHATGIENVPFSDQFQARVAVDYFRHDGYETSGAQAADDISGRLSLLYKPLDDVTIFAWGSYEHDGGTSSNLVNYPYFHPGNPWNDTRPANVPYYPIVAGDQSLSATQAGGQIDWRLGGATLSYIPGYVYVNQYNFDTIGVNALPLFTVINQYTQELKLASDPGTPIKWVGGLYWYSFSDHFIFNAGPFRIIDIPRTNEDEYAAYGQFTYPVLDWFRVIGGARYSLAEKSGFGYEEGFGNTPSFTFDHHWPHVDWKAGVEADVAENSMAYATVQTGWNQGTFNSYPDTAAQNNLVEPTKLLAFTAGIKNRFFDNKVEINDEAYYYNYKDFLVQAANVQTDQISFYDANKVVIWGDEIDARLHLTQDDQIDASIGYLHARNRDFVLAGVGNFNNYAVIQAPDVTASVGVQHTWELASGGTLIAETQTHFQTGVWLEFNHPAGGHEGALTKTDLNLTYYAPDESWSAGLWVRNVENTDDRSEGATGGVPGPFAAELEPPRTFGARVSVKFVVPKAPEETAALPPPPAAAPVTAAPVAAPEAARQFQVFFDFDKSDLTEAAMQVVDAAAAAAKTLGSAKIVATGHTDTVGTAAYNKALSERRAHAVQSRLVADGIDGNAIATIGAGKTGLLVPTADGVREPQNRRVEIVLQ